MLEIQVAEVDARAEQRGEGAFERGGIEPGGREQAGFGEGQCVHAGLRVEIRERWRRRRADQAGGGAGFGVRAAGGGRSSVSTFGDCQGPVMR